MIAVELRFPAGRFHATPWGRHVNEGAIEWPPSPWRVLRALMATWYLKGQDLASEGELREIIQVLLPPPSFSLPPATPGHTRHYMPLRESGKTTKIFDTFLHLAPGSSVGMIWPQATLSPGHRKILAGLLERCSYLGRAESWLDACLLEGHDGELNAWPVEGDEPAPGYEQVRLLSPVGEAAHLAWMARTAESQQERRLTELKAAAIAKGKSAESIKLSTKDRQAIDQALPTDLFAALHADTAELRKAGWSLPPGARWVSYLRPADCFAVRPERRRIPDRPMPTVARYALSGAVLPRLLDAVSLGDRIRIALMSRTKDERGNASPVFSGKDDQGHRLDDSHAHAHVLCEANGARDTVTHVTIYAPGGFDEAARLALGRLQKVWGQGGHDLQLILLGMGHAADFGGWEVARGECPMLARSVCWESRTPFVLTRHPKTHRDGRPRLRDDGLQVEGPEAQLLRELGARGLPAPRSITRISHAELGDRRLAWLQFRRERLQGNAPPGQAMGHGFRLVFDELITGPLALGYGCHFGLGQFVPVRETAEAILHGR